MAAKYKKETGKDLGKQAKAKDVSRRMLEVFPALRKLENYSHIWADLQFREAQAVVGTMLILMRKYGVASFSMHDGICPASAPVRQILEVEERRISGSS
jgi:hypothetical protein